MINVCNKIFFQIDYGVNLPKFCCDETDFECINPKLECSHLQIVVSVTFAIAVLVFLINFIQFYKTTRSKTA